MGTEDDRRRWREAQRRRRAGQADGPSRWDRSSLTACGTTQGAYTRHLRAGETPCAACAAFMRDRDASRRAARRQARRDDG